MSNNVSATMCPRLPVPLHSQENGFFKGRCDAVIYFPIISCVVKNSLLRIALTKVNYNTCADYFRGQNLTWTLR